MSLRRINAVIVRHLYLFPRTLERWAENIYWPVIDLVVWGLTSRWVESAGTEVLAAGAHPPHRRRVLAGRLAGELRDLGQPAGGVLEPEPGQPLRHPAHASGNGRSAWWSWACSRICSRSWSAAGAVWLLYRLNIFQVGWLILPFLFSLLISGWFMGFAGAGVIIYYGRKVQSVAWIAGFALAPFSAVYYPVKVLPGWAQAISYALPMTYIFEGMREVLRGGSDAGPGPGRSASS